MITFLFFKEWQLVRLFIRKTITYVIVGELAFVLWLQLSQVWVLLSRQWWCVKWLKTTILGGLSFTPVM